MSARSNMTMRARVERPGKRSDTSWGTTPKPTFEEQGEIACRVWSRTRRMPDVTDSSKTAIVEDLRAHVPRDADVEEGDQLVDVRNRLGVVLYDGPLAVQFKTRGGGPASAVGYYVLMLARSR